MIRFRHFLGVLLFAAGAILLITVLNLTWEHVKFYVMFLGSGVLIYLGIELFTGELL